MLLQSVQGYQDICYSIYLKTTTLLGGGNRTNDLGSTIHAALWFKLGSCLFLLLIYHSWSASLELIEPRTSPLYEFSGHIGKGEDTPIS